jgi:hypothetical protein
MKPGDILCLENTRFHPGEERNDPGFVAQLAALGGRQGNRWMQVERNVERLRALEDRPKPLVVEKDIVGEAMDEHFRIAHAFGANEERRQLHFSVRRMIAFPRSVAERSFLATTERTVTNA